MDFVVGLPWSNGFNAILNVTCRLTKMRHLISCRDDTSAEQLAELYIRHVFRFHGFLDTIVSDRGPQFDIQVEGYRGKGVKQMQIFCFDLMLTVLMTRRRLGLGFLIHDSHLFDGMDSRQSIYINS